MHLFVLIINTHHIRRSKIQRQTREVHFGSGNLEVDNKMWVLLVEHASGEDGKWVVTLLLDMVTALVAEGLWTVWRISFAEPCPQQTLGEVSFSVSILPCQDGWAHLAALFLEVPNGHGNRLLCCWEQVFLGGQRSSASFYSFYI